jgi:hypothetical protein
MDAGNGLGLGMICHVPEHEFLGRGWPMDERNKEIRRLSVYCNSIKVKHLLHQERVEKNL